MSKFKVLMDVLKRPSSLPYIILSKYPHLIKDDRKFVEFMWKQKMDYPLNLDNPKTFNEKLQWLKLYDHRPEYTKMVDKYEVKDYVAKIIGEEHIIPTIGVWEKVEDINFEELPNQFVLKCTHDSGGLIICKDKSQLNIDEVKKKLQSSLNRNYYLQGREWPYMNVKPKIIAEKYMVDESGKELKDYKFFCFDGEPKFMKIDFNRYSDHHANYYTIKGDLLPFYENICPRDTNAEIEFPSNITEMTNLAKKLSINKPFIRVDFYNINSNVYFGELTFYPASGFGIIKPHEWDSKIGEMLKLPEK